MEGGGSLNHCPSCGSDTTKLTSERIVVDTCGHYKCRKCLLHEDHGCATCRVQSEMREVPERHSVIVSRKQPSAPNSFSNQPTPSPIAWTQEPVTTFRSEEAPVHDESSNTNPAIISTTQSSYSDGNNRQTKRKATIWSKTGYALLTSPRTGNLLRKTRTLTVNPAISPTLTMMQSFRGERR